MKVLLVIIAILTLIVVTLIFIIKSKNKTINFQNIQLNEKIQTIKDRDRDISNIKEEMEIEKRNNEKLVKKLADISCMSINDVLKQLQK